MGKFFCVWGKGVVSLRGGYVGDLICKVIVEILVKLSEE